MEKKIRGQGTIEYLLLIGTIITIALFAVGLVTNFFNFDSNLNTMQNKQYWSTKIIAINEAIVDNDGNAIISITNNLSHIITIVGYSIGEKKTSITEEIFLPGQTKKLETNLGECENPCVYKNFFLHYKIEDSTQEFNSGGRDLIPGKKN